MDFWALLFYDIFTNPEPYLRGMLGRASVRTHKKTTTSSNVPHGFPKHVAVTNSEATALDVRNRVHLLKIFLIG